MRNHSILFFLIFLSYFLFLIQSSFIVHFTTSFLFSIIIFLIPVLFIFIEPTDSFNGVFLFFTIGFFWDLFSFSILGKHALLLVLIYFLTKLFLKKYVRISEFKRI